MGDYELKQAMHFTQAKECLAPHKYSTHASYYYFWSKLNSVNVRDKNILTY